MAVSLKKAYSASGLSDALTVKGRARGCLGVFIAAPGQVPAMPVTDKK
jgi:hypothetical protein